MITFSLNAEGLYFGAGLSQSKSNQHQYSCFGYIKTQDENRGRAETSLG